MSAATQDRVRILVRLPNWLGDVVMSLGALHNLGHLFPKGEIEVIVRADMAELAATFPHIKKVHPFLKNKHRGLRKLYQYGRSCGAERVIDYYITLPYSFSSAWMGYATGARRRIGLRGDARSFLLTHAYDTPKKLHRAELYNSLIDRYFGLDPRALNVCFQLPTSSRRILPRAPMSIALGFVSNNTARSLPTTLAHNYIDKLVECYPSAQFFLIGAPNHRPYIEQICSGRSKLRDRLHNIAGTTTILELAYLLKEVDLLIATESGPAHLANSIGTPLVTLCGASDEHKTGPYVMHNQVRLRVKGLPCAPCFREKCKLPKTLCLLGISADEVLKAAQQLLGTRQEVAT